jgi:hypothetical protein
MIHETVLKTAAAAAVAVFVASSSHAASVTFDFEFGSGETDQRTLMGGVFFPTEQVPVLTRVVEFTITNSTGDTWKSFVLDAPSPPPVTFSNFDGPAGSFGNITDSGPSSDAVIAIGGIHVESGDTLTFLLDINRSSGFVTSVGLWGTPSASEIAPVPLPAAAWMLLAGAGALGAVARKRKG